MRHHSNREAWLQAAVELLRPIFLAKHHTIAQDVLVSSFGFASTGMGDWTHQ
jgi:hypothetical protein